MKSSEPIVSKGEFAKICQVSPGRVTQWISEGKLTGDALVGEGRAAKIKVSVAQRQLRLRRDVGQAHANGSKTRLKPRAEPPEPCIDEDEPEPDEPSPASRALGAADEAVDAAIKRAKLEAIERTNRIEAAAEAASQGRYTETVAIRAEMGRIAGQIMRVFEGALPEISTAIAAEFKLDARDVTHQLNELFRRVRERAADAADQAAGRMAEVVPDTCG